MVKVPYVRFPVLARNGEGRIGSAELIAAVIEEIESGRLVAGSRLPPVRVLERNLGPSKNTVQAAYEELALRGLIEAREREGWFVSARLARAAPEPLPPPPLPKLKPAPVLGPPRAAKDGIALSVVFIDPELLPTEKLADCARSVLRQPGMAALYDAQGYPPLRAAIAERLNARGFSVSPEEVIITTGSQQAIDLVARALEVRRVATETPVYAHGRHVFESFGIQVTGLPLDPFGRVDLADWAARLERTRPGALYAITSFQNPTGYSYSTHELEQLIALSRRFDFALIEDDWGSDMLPDGEPRPTLRQLGGRSVTYINSFTKKLLPSLRVGYLIADPSLVPTLVGMKRLGTLGNAWLTEAIVCEFLERGYYDRHLSELGQALEARYERCLEILRRLMPEDVRFTTPGGGPTLWLELPKEIDLVALAKATADRGVYIESTNNAYLGEPHLNGFRVSYAYSAPEKLERGLTILAEEIRRARGLRPSPA
ncbi:MAG: PLP-dependent aminotransferase family protein [Myxococcota bacterium]